MKLSPSVTFEEVKRQRRMDAPIPFDVTEGKTPKRDEYLKFSLRTKPAEADSETYDKSILYFKGGSPERTLRFVRDLKLVIEGQNVTTGPPSYVIARSLLKGEAL